jgi:aspartate-semialdehyde dehydrogenase
VTKWKLASQIPEEVKTMKVLQCKPDVGGFSECGVVFSGLDQDVAGEIGEFQLFCVQPTGGRRITEKVGTRTDSAEFAFRAAELVVFSNAKNYRRDPVVPLIVPLVNPSHLDVIPHQQSTLSPPLKKGFLVTNANCSTTGLVVPLAALEKAFGPVKTVLVTTMQAISGSGYPGVPSLDIIDNVVPYIGSEEEKIEWETSKILGGVTDDRKAFDYHASSPIDISAHCNRVPVIDGHTACVSVRFTQNPPPSVEQVNEAFRSFTTEAQALGVPSAPGQAIVLHEAPDRPQPRLDRDLHKGACVSVGRVRECNVLDIKFVCLIDNVRLGAATSSVMNAEIAVEKGHIS